MCARCISVLFSRAGVMKKTLALIALIAAASIGSGQSIFENFDNIGASTSNGQLFGANLEAQGWYLQNNSAGNGLTDWFQGNTAVFSQHATSGYIAANFNNASGLGTISNWLL